MNGDIGFYTILPDQIQVANPVMILLFIPIFNFGVYPLLNKFGLLKSPLQKIVTGITGIIWAGDAKKRATDNLTKFVIGISGIGWSGEAQKIGNQIQ